MRGLQRRSCSIDGGGKVIWRGDSVGTAGVRPDTFHTLTAQRRNSLRDPDGVVVRQWSRCCENKSEEQLGFVPWWQGAASSALEGSGALTAPATALRLHHYVTRSAAECRRKVTDQSRPGSVEWGHAWRTGRMDMCACSPRLQCNDRDGRDRQRPVVAQFTPLIRRETQRLFGTAALELRHARVGPTSDASADLLYLIIDDVCSRR